MVLGFDVMNERVNCDVRIENGVLGILLLILWLFGEERLRIRYNFFNWLFLEIILK